MIVSPYRADYRLCASRCTYRNSQVQEGEPYASKNFPNLWMLSNVWNLHARLFDGAMLQKYRNIPIYYHIKWRGAKIFGGVETLRRIGALFGNGLSTWPNSTNYGTSATIPNLKTRCARPTTSRNRKQKHIGRNVFQFSVCLLTVAMRDTCDKKLKELDAHRRIELRKVEDYLARKYAHSGKPPLPVRSIWIIALGGKAVLCLE